MPGHKPQGPSDESADLASTRSFLTRSWTRSLDKTRSYQQPPKESSKGPLGLTTLSSPSDNVPVVADLIFVHGLNGGSYSTWTKGGDASKFWPREWLPFDTGMNDVRIHTFGYPSAISKESVLNVRDFARSLLASIKDTPCIAKDPKKVIFVAHSMGGLVVKMASVLARHDPSYAQLFDRICAILFLATPHQGAAIAQTLNRLLSLVSGSRPFVDDLVPDSPVLQAISEDFPVISTHIQLMSFFETLPMSLGINRLIVEKACAVMNLPNERKQLLNADHRSIAMYSTKEDSCYNAIRNALVTLSESLRDVMTPVRQGWHADLTASVLSREPARAPNLASYLGINESPDDNLSTRDSRRIPGSCQWLKTKNSYISWTNGKGSGTLWLRGRPGTGKSILSAYVINDVRQQSKDCCHYFFQRGDSVNASIGMFLRTIAFQMATLHANIASSITELLENDPETTLEHVDPSILWRKLFSVILKAKMSKAQYWIIDAVEECRASTEAIMYLTRMQDHWPIRLFITSRDAEDTHLMAPMVDLVRETITVADTMEDISIYLRGLKSFLPYTPSSNWQTPEEMADYIVKRSDGCFLWARLICDELRKVSRLSEIEDVLDNTPANMDRLYTSMLENMNKAQFGHELARVTLMWTSYSFRPLTTTELREPVEATICDKVDEDMERSIAKCCGNLVSVDEQGRVRLVHATAKEFLTRPTTTSTFAVAKGDAHAKIVAICLDHLTTRDANTGKVRRASSDRRVQRADQPKLEFPFTDYASKYAFQHLAYVSSTTDFIMPKLAKFFSSRSVLSWIEYIAINADLRILFQAGKSLNKLLSQRARHSPPLGFARKQYELLEQWGDDLIHLVTKFSKWLKLVPQSINHLIPAFCPTMSALRRQFSSPFKGIQVTGLPTSHWDDCLVTIIYPKGTKPNVVDSGPGFFAVGTITGKVIVYEDAIFQEVYTLQHCEPVWRLAFSKNTKQMASAGARKVRIWCLERGIEIACFPIPSLCLSLAFVREDLELVATTSSNLMQIWEIKSKVLVEELVNWTVDFENDAPELQGRAPAMVGSAKNMDFLAIVYRGQEILFWDLNDFCIRDFYNKDLGSRVLNGKKDAVEILSTVGALTLNDSPGMNRMAVTYTDGDLVLFDLETGKPLALASRANTMLLASSHDGRTLAGIDSLGNLTLFDFETLRVLYKVQFETYGMAKGLAFTSDSLRFIELRGDQCRVWEPAVLIRQELDDDANSDTISLSTFPKKIENSSERGIMITSVFCSLRTSIVICGREDGSILIYDTNGQPEGQPLAEPSPGFPIRLLIFDDTHNVLISDDMGRVRARTIERTPGPRQGKTWRVREVLSSTLATDNVAQILVSVKLSRLLISTSQNDTLWPLPKQGEGLWITQLPHRGASGWVNHSSKPELLIHVSEEVLNTYSWINLEKIGCVDMAKDGQLRSYNLTRIIPLQPLPCFCIMMDSVSDNILPTKRVLVYECSSQNGTGSDISLVHDLGPSSSQVDFVIGAYGSRLVVYTTDHWVASFRLNHCQPDEPFVKHFFVPFDWMRVSGKPLMSIGIGGEIALAKQADLAIIKRGLEVTMEGANFNPRRCSQRTSVPRRPAITPGAGQKIKSSPL